MEDALVSEFLMVAVPLVRSLPPAIKPKPVGAKPISFELKALALLIKAWHDLTYEGTVAELRDHWQEFQRYGYDEIPSDTTLWRAMKLIPPSWFRLLNQELNKLFDGDGRWTGDSTGFSTSTYVRWRDLTGNIESMKRAALKLHCLIQLPFLNIPCMEVTDGTAADAPMLRRLVRQLKLKDMEEVALDSGYLARWVCTMLAERGVEKILIKPKRNTTAKSLGSPAWRRMMLNYIDDEDDFIERYNGIRPKAETTFSSLKRTIAHWLRSRKRRMQRKEAYMYVIAYNVVRAVINPIRLI